MPFRLVPSQLANSLGLRKWIKTMAFIGQSKYLHILAGIFLLDILYLEGKSPLLMSNIQVNFGDILPETSKSSAFWDMGVDSHLELLLLFSPNVNSDSTSLGCHFHYFWRISYFVRKMECSIKNHKEVYRILLL